MMYETRGHTIWPEKYRPDSLDTYIGNEKIKQKFQQYIQDQDIPHLLFYGPAGTGKTTAAKLLSKQIESDVLFLNASDDNNIETVRSKIRSFAATRGFKPLKIIVLDEFDGFTKAGQGALRNIMEQFSQSTRFILTANYLERLIEPIVSRTQSFEVLPPSKKETAIHLSNILKKENVGFTINDIKFLIDAYFPDIRKILNEAQSASREGTLCLDQNETINTSVPLQVVAILTEPATTPQRFTNIRQCVANARLRDYTDVYRLLYEKVDTYAKNHIPEAIVCICEGHRWDSQVVDKELNFMAMIATLLPLLK